MPGQGTRHHQT
ncbi:hypothetical protein F383_08494 [Gossypium arboreum]|uniref:Uncharacterized protein n=1 Tax=Gossypium arboreum TaxID=29729 RepID=A0A0B0PCA4_GOSAR|nr:hypothetical protein F383_08494 [Gossypium arboreum]